jgi:prepilin-type N-terminal cleavage/methylation domain-containing protein
MKRGAGRPGMSLVEVLVAMTLALILVVGAAEMLTLSIRAKRRGDVIAALTHAISDRLESLRARPFEDPALTAGEYSETVRVEPGGCLVAETWEIADDGQGMKRIRLKARQAGRPGPETAAVLCVSRDLGFSP